MKPFKYYEPTHLEETIELLKTYGADAELLAGGTDLLLDIQHGLKQPCCVISLSEIDQLAFIAQENDGIRIGATTVLHEIERSSFLCNDYQMLVEGAGVIGSRQIRNLATLGGNICNAVPSADTAAPLLAADAQVVIQGAHGLRYVFLSDFFEGPRQTVLLDDELVTEIMLPKPPVYTGSIYRRHTLRRALDLAVAGVAVSVTMDADGGTFEKVRIALSAVAPTPRRALSAEELLTGRQPTESLLNEAAELAVLASSPISDVRASEDYRKDIIRALTKKCIRQAMARSRQKIGLRGMAVS